MMVKGLLAGLTLGPPEGWLLADTGVEVEGRTYGLLSGETRLSGPLGRNRVTPWALTSVALGSPAA